jgi:hypothetical protein
VWEHSHNNSCTVAAQRVFFMDTNAHFKCG